MEDNILRVVYILNSEEGNIEIRVLADSVEQRNGQVNSILAK